MNDDDFGAIVARLFSVLGLRSDPEALKHLGYTIKVDDGLHVDMIGLQEGFVNLRAELGVLPKNFPGDLLLRMLHANQFAFDHPPVSIGIDPEDSGVVIWSRQAVGELRKDIDCHWFERFMKMASMLREWLHGAPERRAGSRPVSPVERQKSFMHQHFGREAGTGDK